MAERKRENNRKNIQFQIKDFSSVYTNQIFEILKENFENPWNKKLINSSCKISKVVLQENKVLAYICVDFVFDEAEIHMIAVKTQLQNRGIGSLLLKEILNSLKRKNVKKVFLEVNENNKIAICFYKKFGFKEVFKRKKYYKNNDDAIIMELIL